MKRHPAADRNSLPNASLYQPRRYYPRCLLPASYRALSRPRLRHQGPQSGRVKDYTPIDVKDFAPVDVQDHSPIDVQGQYPGRCAGPHSGRYHRTWG